MNTQAHELYTGNSFIDSLKDETRDALLPRLKNVALKKDQVLAFPGQRSQFVYFPIHSIISAQTAMTDGTSVEVGVAGHEGVSPPSIAFGNHVNANSAVVQAAGSAHCMNAEIFAEQLRIDPHLQQRMMAYVEYSYIASMQFAACNRCHLIGQRYARSLLMAFDRIGSDTLVLTHEDSAEILGVRRAGISVAAMALRVAGLITYHRGTVAVIDRLGLEAAACECYGIGNAQLLRCMGYGARRRSLSDVAA